MTLYSILFLLWNSKFTRLFKLKLGSGRPTKIQYQWQNNGRIKFWVKIFVAKYDIKETEKLYFGEVEYLKIGTFYDTKCSMRYIYGTMCISNHYKRKWSQQQQSCVGWSGWN